MWVLCAWTMDVDVDDLINKKADKEELSSFREKIL